MDADRVSFLAGPYNKPVCVIQPTKLIPHTTQVEYYGKTTMNSSHQSTTIPQLRLSTAENYPRKVIYIVQQNHHNTHLAVQSAIWGQRTTVLVQLLAALERAQGNPSSDNTQTCSG